MTAEQRGDAQAIVDVATAAARGQELEDGLRTAFVVPAGGRVEVVGPVAEGTLEHPRRVLGETRVRDVPSFAALYVKHREEAATEVFADVQTSLVTAVLNADRALDGTDFPEDRAGWRDHRLVLECRRTPAWSAWEQADGVEMSQELFAEFIEDRTADIRKPSGAEMLELAQTFATTTKVDFKSAVAVSSGVRSLVYEETSSAKAGAKGSIEIPTVLELALQPFEGGSAYKVRARFRYRIRNETLVLFVKLERPEDVLREAFDDLAAEVASTTGAEVLSGVPPRARC